MGLAIAIVSFLITLTGLYVLRNFWIPKKRYHFILFWRDPFWRAVAGKSDQILTDADIKSLYEGSTWSSVLQGNGSTRLGARLDLMHELRKQERNGFLETRKERKERRRSEQGITHFKTARFFGRRYKDTDHALRILTPSES